jgi:hypothetical protein
MGEKSLLKKETTLVEKKISFNNFKRGVDEEKIYGPICFFLFILYIFLFFFDLINLNVFLVACLILFWNFFIYYPFHKTIISILTLLITLIPLIIGGFYLLYTHKITFFNIAYLSYFWWFSMIIALLLEYSACKKHDITQVDIFFGACKRTFGSWIIPILAIFSSVVFLSFASTYFLFGQSHLYLWVIIFVFWIISGIRTFKYKVLR